MPVRQFGIAAILSVVSFAAHAAVINFNGLAGANGAHFSSYTEDGFTVQKGAGQFLVGKVYGDPVPSLFSGYDDENLGGTTSASITITDGGGVFTFGGADLANDLGLGTFTFTGYDDGSLVYQQSGLILSAAFADYASIAPGVDLTSLSITESGGDFNVDNIDVSGATSVTPEPSSIMLLGTGLLGLAGVVRRRLA